MIVKDSSTRHFHFPYALGMSDQLHLVQSRDFVDWVMNSVVCQYMKVMKKTDNLITGWAGISFYFEPYTSLGANQGSNEWCILVLNRYQEEVNDTIFS